MEKKKLYQTLIILAFVLFAIILFWIVFTNPYNTQLNGAILIASAIGVLTIVNYLSFKLGL